MISGTQLASGPGLHIGPRPMYGPIARTTRWPIRPITRMPPWAYGHAIHRGEGCRHLYVSLGFLYASCACVACVACVRGVQLGVQLGVQNKVLFVAEKAVALDVVRERLQRVGLGELILDLHISQGGSKV